MTYIENPKTKGSGIICAIPQSERCPNNCPDCFFQSGRSYLEPLKENLPNMPAPIDAFKRIVRINDGGDSSVGYDEWAVDVGHFYHKFYNTIDPTNLEKFDAPVVLTVNPGAMTDYDWYAPETVTKNLMFVRARTNTWNLPLVYDIVDYYSESEVPIVLTFMAYHSVESIPETHRNDYIMRKRTINTYWAITTSAWERVMECFKRNKWVYSCGKIEGELGDSHCRFCGNCLREYFACMERMRNAT